ncbi:MAG: AmmeMemoRadiSam system protein B [Candidatus Woesearchaeota archaeon]|jgi:hypothetical protein|nr:AmmeMemoRadiSam system protein B [Candidatus Woesearchaeota archaeon]MDP7622794.1 AmmeMemoRadiSam system protein B [Candidatus Woesearchaeota archaeon]HJN56473.1 AmmeMemoRadiSam system protein B [Candidatus Woesearchaeota archaeon]|tara:strand:- start:86961 stop:87725 length:765 start_codon:yes stop_codon:yes gene_type:complete
MTTRKPAVSGMFYPSDKSELDIMIDEFLDSVPKIKIEGKLKAIIVPHAGYIYSGKVAAFAYSLLREYKNKFKKVIILGPSHHVYFDDAASDVNEVWESPLGQVKVMENNLKKLEEPHVKEHSLEVQIPFLQKILKDFEILPMVAGDADPKKISDCIQPLLNDDTLFVVSSDLSHYNSYDDAIEIDENTNVGIENLDYEKVKTEGDACGKIPILVLIDIAKRFKWKCRLLEYKNSGDETNTKDGVVGYSSFAFYK